MRLNISNNIKEVQRGLNDVAQRQIPFATSLAINDVLNEIKRNTEKRMRRVLHNPTPFTLRGVAVRRSSKRNQTGIVFIKDIQAEYLKRLEEGGDRRPNRRALLVPVGQRVNKYGNLPRGAVGRTLAKPAVFSGSPKGNARAGGIYQRIGKGRSARLKLLIHYTDIARYIPKLGFQRGAQKTANARLPSAMRKALLRAVSSAR
ncbi:MAG: hypothetical protein ABJL72_12235 [Roseobacter sp.]